MKALVLGGAGFVGRAVVRALVQHGHTVQIASRRPRTTVSGVQYVVADVTDRGQLKVALNGIELLVNCVTGKAQTIIESTRAIADCLERSTCRHVVHMSSMAVYGDIEGTIDDAHAPGGGGGWYAEAKREAEGILTASSKDRLVHILRPGCVYGPGSSLWVWRVGAWVKARRLGDLGASGDGWSNLVHVDDVADAVASLAIDDGAAGGATIMNLVAPDSPRWNRYLVDFALNLDATPVRRITRRRLLFESKVAAAPLRVWEILAPRLRVPPKFIPPAIPGSVLYLMGQQRRLVSPSADRILGGCWRSYEVGLSDSVRWFREMSQ